MKQFKRFLILLVLPLTAFGGPMIKKEQAKRIIRRTAVVILAAHKKVKEGKVYTGDLARAIAHQKFAIKLYREGKYFKAIHHSRRARMLAIMAIKANKGAETSEMKYEKGDENAFKGGPSDDELDKEVAKEMPAEAAAKDEEVVAAEPAVDLNDNE
jgi:hypothetical protein